MKHFSQIFLAASLLISSLAPSYSMAAMERTPAQAFTAQDLGSDARAFSREFTDLADRTRTVSYSLDNIDAMLGDLETLDRIVKMSISEQSAIEAVNRLASAIDLYTLILQDQRIKPEEKIGHTSNLEGKIYQSFITLLRHYGADPVDPNSRQIPNRSIFKKIIQEMGIDVRSFASRPRDAFGQRVYAPFEKLYRDQATQQVIAKLQQLAADAHTTADGDGGLIAQNSRDMMKEIAIDNSVKTVNDRRAAQWVTAGTYGFLAVASFFVIVDYVGIVDGMLGGVGRTEVSQLVTGIINFSLLFSVATLKAASIRAHVRTMVLNLQEILKDPKNLANRTPIRRSLATWLFRKRIDFDSELTKLQQATTIRASGGAGARCHAVHN